MRNESESVGAKNQIHLGKEYESMETRIWGKCGEGRWGSEELKIKLSEKASQNTRTWDSQDATDWDSQKTRSDPHTEALQLTA